MGAYPVKFGKYMLLERVNVGGMAEVFKAKTFGVAGFERILAIKRILPSLVEDDEFIRMFIDEARIAVQLNHANIVQIYELGKHGEHYYIAMEYLPSRDLRSILDRLRAAGQLMPIAQAAFVTSKVCEGLDYAHRRRDPSGEPMNIIHRDVSPQNILITYEGDIKVIDFGIAKAANRASKTQAGVLKGKFGYMSPEQVRGLPIDRRSDIFAVGVLLYEMLTGERLFIGESDFSTLERVRNAEVIPPTTFNKKISPELEQIVLKSLAREAEDRYQWASDLAEDLQSFLIEDRSIYNPKRLGAQMKETYAAEIAAERAKMEEFLSIAMDNTPNEVPESSAEALPSPYVEVKAQPSIDTNTDRLPDPDDGIDFNVDDADQFEEDKTFVIEASEAGKALQKSDPDDDAEPHSDPSLRAPRVPEHTDDDFLQGASLYGEEASDLEDDAATMVSAANPFDEVNRRTDEGGEPNGGRTLASLPDVSPHSETHAAFDHLAPSNTDPQARSLSASSATQHDGGLSQPAPRARASMGQTGEEPARNGGGVSGLMPADPDEPTRAAPSESFGDDVAGRQLPRQSLQAPAAEPPPPALAEPVPSSPQPSTLEHADSTERALRAPEPGTMGGMSRGMVLGLAVGLTVAFVAFAGVAIGVVLKVSGGDEVPIVLAPPDPANPPAEVKVFLDGDLVAESLPAQVVFTDGAGQVLRVEAEGYAPFELPVPTVNATMSPLTLPLKPLVPEAAEAAPAEPTPEPADKPKPEPADKPAATKPVEVAAAAAPPPKPDAPVPVTPEPPAPDPAAAGAKPEQPPSAAPEREQGEGPTAVQLATLAGPSWRVSFTTLAEGAPVHGARVLLAGRLLGTTPFEMDVSSDVERLALEVRAEGYAAKQLEIVRNGRQRVGPGTLRLVRPPAGEAAPAGASDDAETEAAAEPAKEPAGEGTDDKAPPPSDKPVAATEPAAAPAEPRPSPPAEPAKAASSEPSERASRAQQPRQDQRRARDRRVELSLGTRPFASVIVDGKKLAQTTPLMGARALKLRPGDHVIQFVDTKTNKKYRYKVTLPADSPKNKLIIILGGDIRVKEGKAKAVELK